MSLLSKAGEYLQIFKLMREASRLGVDVDDLPLDVVAAALRHRKADPARHGLVPDAALTTKPAPDPELDHATAAAKAGQWEPAAWLIARTWLDWDRRAVVVDHFGALAAHDDIWLAAWRAARPDDGDLAVVHADSLVSLAWKIRGSAYAHETSRGQAGGFRLVLGQAEEAAWDATRRMPDDPTPWVTLITLARGLSYDHDAFGRLWNGLVERAPHHLGGHVQALQYWCRKWHGSHEQMNAFADRAAASSPTLVRLPFYAAMEMDGPDGAEWRSLSVQRSIATMLAQPNLTNDDRGWLAYALTQSKRYDEAVEQFRVLGTDASGSPWTSWDDDAKLMFAETRAKACRYARPRR